MDVQPGAAGVDVVDVQPGAAGADVVSGEVVEGWSVWGERIGAGIVAVGVMVVAVSMAVAVPTAAVEVRQGSSSSSGGGGEQRPKSERAAYHLVVDINRDSWQRLSLVPGIGEKTAITIVEWRDRLGGFRSVDDLLRISGIGPRKLDRWRPYLTLSTRPPPPRQTETESPTD